MLLNKNRNLTCAVQGGLGNQLFILAASLSQALRLEVPLVLNISPLKRIHKDATPHDFQLEALVKEINYPIEVTETSISNYSRKVPSFLAGARLLPPYIEKTLNYDSRIQQVNVGQTLWGYFQSPLYISNRSEELLASALTTISNKKSLNESDDIHIHIRRGDYLNEKVRSRHGIANIDYFDAALHVLTAISPSSRVKVFSDSPEKIPKTFLNRWDAAIDTDQIEYDPLIALLLLSSSNKLILSNSSFSWWAGWISDCRFQNSSVVAPRPWLKEEIHSHSILKPNWISLGIY